MNDKELADKVMALGVGYRSGPHAYGIFLAEGTSERIGGPEDLVRDPRVAMALMEKAPGLTYCVSGGGWNAWVVNRSHEGIYGPYESLPRAITEACVEALNSSES